MAPMIAMINIVLGQNYKSVKEKKIVSKGNLQRIRVRYK